MSGSGRIYGRKCDVTNESEVLAVFAWIRDTLGGVDVFVNNAGIMKAAFLIGLCYVVEFVIGIAGAKL